MTLTAIALAIALTGSPASITVEQFTALPSAQQHAFAYGYSAGMHYMASQWLVDQASYGATDENLNEWAVWFDFYTQTPPSELRALFTAARASKTVNRAYAEHMQRKLNSDITKEL